MALTDQQDHVYWIERDKIAISKYDSSANIDNRFTGPAGGKAITLFIIKDATSLTTTLADVPGIPEEFHDALVFRAVQRGYEVKMSQSPEMVKNASYFQGGFDKIVAEGKKYANLNRTGGSYYVGGDEY